jgi:branched-chain amino acid transport system ATP-binding protein
MLCVEGLTGGWGPTTVVENFDIKIEAGEVVSILGRNGVGKTTVLELITGRAKYRAGSVQVKGRCVQGLPIYERCRAGIGYVPQAREIFPRLTVDENLIVAARPGFYDRTGLYNLFPLLAKRKFSHGSQLSGGEQQILSLARALIGNPAVLLMDEPTEGLAPIIVEQIVEVVKALAAQGEMAILLVEQIIDVALDLSDRCLVMDRGRIVHSGDIEELRRDRMLLQSLMGFERSAR